MQVVTVQAETHKYNFNSQALFPIVNKSEYFRLHAVAPVFSQNWLRWLFLQRYMPVNPEESYRVLRHAIQMHLHVTPGGAIFLK